MKRSNNVIVVKNIPFATELDELQKLFGKYGQINRVVLPPAKTIAIVEFVHVNDAKLAFRNLAYTKFKMGLPLKLEWAPVGIITSNGSKTTPNPETQSDNRETTVAAEKAQVEKKQTQKQNPREEAVKLEEDLDISESKTLYVKNLNFETRENSLRSLCSQFGNVVNVTIARKKDPKDSEKMLSMGFGFIEYATKQDALNAIKKLHVISTIGYHFFLLF